MRFNEDDANKINRRRTTSKSIAERIKQAIWPLGAQAHIGSVVKAGQFVAAIVVSEPGYGSSALEGYADLQCLLPGNDQYWVQAQQSPNKWVEPGYWMPS